MSGRGCGLPLEVSYGLKQKKCVHTAVYYMYIRRISQDTPCRFDAVGIMGESIQWIQDAF